MITLDKDIYNEPTQCVTCEHLIDYVDETCKAFPDGIPKEILTGEFKHTKKHPEQDNDIVREEIKPEK